MSSLTRFRDSAERINRHHGLTDVTLERGAVSLFESISGSVASLTCSSALADEIELPMSSTEALRGRISPGVGLSIAGHAITYVVQSLSEPAGSTITVTLDVGLEFDVGGESVTLSPRSLSFIGGQVNLAAGKIPADWTVGAEDEIWALVPPNTNAGAEPRTGDRMTAPYDAVIGDVGGRERVEYLVQVTPMAVEEAVAA